MLFRFLAAIPLLEFISPVGAGSSGQQDNKPDWIPEWVKGGADQDSTLEWLSAWAKRGADSVSLEPIDSGKYLDQKYMCSEIAGLTSAIVYRWKVDKVDKELTKRRLSAVVEMLEKDFETDRKIGNVLAPVVKAFLRELETGGPTVQTETDLLNCCLDHE